MNFDDLKRWYHVRKGYWFAPKLFGWGATPVTWQGWALTLGFVGALILNVRFAPRGVAKLAIGGALVVAFIAIAKSRTDGGWRWRWGPDRR